MKFLNIKAIIFSMVLLHQSLFALQEEQLQSFMNNKINQATQILQDKSLDIQIKEDQIFSMFDSVFDYVLMAKLSLGKQWNALTQEQQTIFSTSFENRLKEAYIDKLHLYNNQKIKIEPFVKSNPSRIELPMYILGEEENFEVIYKFYKNKQNEWFIYDVNILGVSIIQTYRNQFVGVLQKESFESLIDKLKRVEVAQK
jgi:phospholipid transport system substrate-binding protein